MIRCDSDVGHAITSYNEIRNRKSNWYSSYNSFQLYDCNHQVCHRWRFLTNDVRLWKDKIAVLGKLVSCVIFIGSSPKGPCYKPSLLPNLRNKVTKRHILLQHCTCILRYTSSDQLYSCLLVENIHAHLTEDSWIFQGGGGVSEAKCFRGILTVLTHCFLPKMHFF